MALFSKSRKESSSPSEKQEPAPSYDEAVRSASSTKPDGPVLEQVGTLIDATQLGDAETADEHEEIVTNLRVHAFTDSRVLLVDTSFTWEISDYDLVIESVAEEGGYVRSPPHIVDGFSWTIRLYPFDKETREYMSCYVEVEPVKKRKLGWKLGAEYGIVAWNPDVPQVNESAMSSDRVFEYGDAAWGWKKFCKRERLIKAAGNQKAPLLHGNSLNITAYIRTYKL